MTKAIVITIGVVLIGGFVFFSGCGRHIWEPQVEKAVNEKKQVQVMKDQLEIQTRIAIALEKIAKIDN